MAAINKTRLFYVMLILLISGSGKLIAGATLVEDVCRETHDQQFCLKVLRSRSDPGNDAVKLAQIVIDLLRDVTINAKYKVHYLWQTENNPVLKDHFAWCEYCYGDAVGNVRDATDLFNRHLYQGLSLDGLKSFGDSQQCEQGFQTAKTPLSDENYKMMRFSEMLSIVANKLTG